MSAPYRIAALDLGSNSFHLLIVEVRPDGSFEPIAREKEMLRLGDVVSRHGRVPDGDADRAVDAVRRFRLLAEGAGVDEIVVCATSAMREAANGDELVDRLADEGGVDVEVISGREEARLIFDAVRASVVLDPAPAVCFDLGGGSLEVMVGDRGGLRWATSVHLGVARLTAELVRDDPPSKGDVARLAERFTSVLGPVAAEVDRFGPRLAVGSSGTLCDLARMVAARRDGVVPRSVNQFSFTHDEFRELHAELLSLPAGKRAKLPGLEAKRADQIPTGSLFLATAFELFGFDRFAVSEWALREGMVLDAIGHHDRADFSGDVGAIRRASVVELARRCNWDEAHSRHVAALAAQLFDGTRELHGLGDGERDLLEHAALVHDIGEHVSHEAHHKHSAYLVQHGRLRGFTPEEVDTLAALARYHRSGDPKPSHEPFGGLRPETQDRVRRLASVLRLADGLDRGHAQIVRRVDVEVRPASVRLVLDGEPGCDLDLEIWGVRRKRDLFEKLFGRAVDVLPGSSVAVHPSFTREPPNGS